MIKCGPNGSIFLVVTNFFTETRNTLIFFLTFHRVACSSRNNNIWEGGGRGGVEEILEQERDLFDRLSIMSSRRKGNS